MKNELYVQCVLKKDNLTDISWIKKELAVEGQYATFPDEDGVWLIEKAFSNVVLPWSEINDRGQDFKRTRQASDI